MWLGRAIALRSVPFCKSSAHRRECDRKNSYNVAAAAAATATAAV